jgi:hypothetical protein
MSITNSKKQVKESSYFKGTDYIPVIIIVIFFILAFSCEFILKLTLGISEDSASYMTNVCLVCIGAGCVFSIYSCWYADWF